MEQKQKESILKSIQRIKGVCEEGRKGIKELVEEIIGEKLGEEKKPSITDFSLGDIFSLGFIRICIIKTCDDKYLLGGMGNDFSTLYSDGPRTKEEMLTYLNRSDKITKIGMLEPKYF